MSGNIPKYLIAKWDGGRIVITTGNGLPATDEDLNFIQHTIASVIKNKNLEGYQPWKTKYPIEEGYSSPKNKYVVDPIIIKLDNIGKQRGLSRAAISRAIFENPSKLTNLTSGRVLAFLDISRLWAGAVGYDIIAVPMELRDKVNSLVAEYEKAHEHDFDDDNFIKEVKE